MRDVIGSIVTSPVKNAIAECPPGGHINETALNLWWFDHLKLFPALNSLEICYAGVFDVADDKPKLKIPKFKITDRI